MKKIFSIAIPLFLINQLQAQLTITSGAQLYLSGNTQLTLQNTDLVNNGTFTAGTGTVSFTGNSAAAISGTQPVQFYNLEINKTGGSAVLLQRMIGITQQVNFTAGFLNLNNFDADLGTTGFLNGEQENSRITGSNGGQVLLSTTLNNPVNANPGNLGAIITSAQNLGNVVIKRGHQSQLNSYGTGNSVLRYYDILPANNNALNATLRFNYFDSELNGLTESTLVFWRSIDNIHWTNEGFTTRDATANYLEKNNIPSFSRWTLSSINNPLPVMFILFNVKCEGNKVVINWKTTQEQNSSRFDIERSKDGNNWIVIGSLPAAGFSSTEKNYLFTDISPEQSNFYRIAQYDVDNRVLYTMVLKSNCSATEIFRLWPNPVTDILNINISANRPMQMTAKTLDSKGALVKMKTYTLLSGNNLLSVNLKDLPGGLYQLLLEWDNGQMKKTAQIIKQ